MKQFQKGKIQSFLLIGWSTAIISFIVAIFFLLSSLGIFGEMFLAISLSLFILSLAVQVAREHLDNFEHLRGEKKWQGDFYRQLFIINFFVALPILPIGLLYLYYSILRIFNLVNDLIVWIFLPFWVFIAIGFPLVALLAIINLVSLYVYKRKSFVSEKVTLGIIAYSLLTISYATPVLGLLTPFIQKAATVLEQTFYDNVEISKEEAIKTINDCNIRKIGYDSKKIYLYQETQFNKLRKFTDIKYLPDIQKAPFAPTFRCEWIRFEEEK